MKSTFNKLCRTAGGFGLGSLAVAAMIATASYPATAQDALPHDTDAVLDRIPASHLHETCMLIASFPNNEMPENYDDIAVADGWVGVLNRFNSSDVRFLALCLGDRPNRAHVWLESPAENGEFEASGPHYPPHWTISADGSICMGVAGEGGCATLYRHKDSGFLYLSFGSPEDEAEEGETSEGEATADAASEDDEKGGDYWVIVQQEDDTPIYEDIENALDNVDVR